MNRCSSCQWWSSNDDSSGECCRYAPRPFNHPVTETQRFATWPLTLAGDYCGEHQPARAEADLADDLEHERRTKLAHAAAAGPYPKDEMTKMFTEELPL